jgi:flagellin
MPSTVGVAIMAQIINTNIASLNAQRNLNTSQSSLATSLERLSSGLRINSAKDDAAGLAISERFTTQIRGLNQAIRNANDGISLSQTAEGALGEVTNNLQRIRELAIQSRNATNSDTDRAALDSEVQQRLQEIDRIASQTSFNGLNLLDGTFTNQAFQVGAEVGQTISITAIANTRALAGLGLEGGSATTTGTAVQAGFVDGDLIINDVAIDGATADAASIASVINSNVSGVTATATNAQTLTFSNQIADADVPTDGYKLQIDGVYVIGSASATDNDGVTAADVASAIDALDGYSASASGQDITITKTDGSNFTLTEEIVDADGNTDQTGTGFSIDAEGGTETAATYRGLIGLSSGADIEIAGATPANAGLAAGTIASVGTGALMDVLTATNSDNVISKVDSALEVVNTARANLGALQNRFESTIANLSTTSENLAAARSRILDADFASETANLTRAQILQQAGTAILAQANALPQNVLGLLG